MKKDNKNNSKGECIIMANVKNETMDMSAIYRMIDAGYSPEEIQAAVSKAASDYKREQAEKKQRIALKESYKADLADIFIDYLDAIDIISKDNSKDVETMTESFMGFLDALENFKSKNPNGTLKFKFDSSNTPDKDFDDQLKKLSRLFF